MLSNSFQLLAEYNQWMNNNLYAAAAQLSDAERKADRQAYFKSIHGTLNHLLVADIIWLQRFAEHPAQFKALQTIKALPTPTALDAILHADFSPLQQQRQELDKAILDFSLELTDENLQQTFSYQNMKKVKFSNPLRHPLLHFFNHQTHHRGQVTTLLMQAGVDPGVTDLLMLVRDRA